MRPEVGRGDTPHGSMSKSISSSLGLLEIASGMDRRGPVAPNLLRSWRS